MSQHQNNNTLIQQLAKRFDLKAELFSEESGFFFEGAQRQHNIETIRHLASFGDMVLFLTGDKGAGKTQILRQLVSSSFEGLNVVYLDCERLVQEGKGKAGYILDACIHSLGLQTEELGMTENLYCLLAECHRRVAADGVRTLFTFDNADKLPKKELQAYCNFCKELPPESALVMLFSGSSGLIQTTKLGSGLEQGVWWHQIQLKPLSQEDVLPYLDQALMIAGSSEALELTDNQIQQMVDLGKGLPGRINKLFPSVVLEPGLLKIKTKHKKRGTPVLIMFGLSGLLILSFIFVSFQHGLFDRIIPVFSLEEKLEVKTLEVPKGEFVIGDRELDDRDLKQKSRLAMLDRVIREKGISLPLDVQTEEIIEAPLSENGLGNINQKVLGEKIGAGLEKNSIPEVLVLKVEESAEISQEVSVQEKPIAIFVGSDNKEQEKLQEKEIVKQDSVNDKSKVSLSFRSKNWLQAQPGSSYLAQILGSYSEQTALNFIEKIGEQKIDIFYLMTQHKGKPWYVVFYGIFPAKTHAQDAVKNSPKIIRSQNPWIRRSSEVLASYPE